MSAKLRGIATRQQASCMIVPFVLLLLSVAGVVLALAFHGASDLLLLAGPTVVASLYLLVREWLAARRYQRQPRWIIVDGSNVMHWAGDAPRIDPLRELVAHLQSLGLTPRVVFDANAGYLIDGRYRHDRALGQLLGLSEKCVIVVDKGTPADPRILQAARDLHARVVTNDRYRDWAEEFPEVRSPGFLIRGGYRGGSLWLDFDPAGSANQAKDRPGLAVR
jgi:hypothetical protein